MQQSTLAQLSRLALLAQDTAELFGWTATRVAELLDAGSCQIFRRIGEGDSPRLELVARSDRNGDETADLDLDSEVRRQALTTLGAREEPAAGTQGGTPESQRVDVVSEPSSLISVIIRGHPQPFGVLAAQRSSGCEFKHSEVQLLRSVANILAAAIGRLEREEELRRSNLLGRAVIDAFPARVAVLDGHGQLTRVNRRWLEFAQRLGIRCESGTTPNLEELAVLLHPRGDADRRARVLEGIHEVLIGRRPSFAIEYPHQEAQDLRWYLLRVVPMETGRSGAVLIHEDVTERRLFSERLAYQAQHDRLTGLPNRYLFADRLEQGLLHAQRSGKGLAILFLDIDRFKRINDTLGYGVGDEVLRRVAGRLQRQLKDTDTLARMGADEFVAMVAVDNGIGDAMKLARSLLETLREPLIAGEQTIFLTATIGISLFPDDGDEPAALLHKADSALYRAKNSGFDSIHSFSTEMTVEAIARFELESHLRMALDTDQLTICYQPQFDARGLEVTGVEALVRWQHPERGWIAPDVFIKLAEESDLILDLGQWVLQEACRQIADWHRRGLEGLSLAINVSALQLARYDFPERVSKALEVSGLPANRLELEVTESVLLLEGPPVNQRLQDLRSLGVSVSIDDFGTGYSSLAYLQGFPLDRLKIDRRFISRLADGDASSLALVRAIIGLGHGLGMKVVAEGVERQEQLDILQKLGCDAIQGFLLARPQPPEELWHQLERLSSQRTG